MRTLIIKSVLIAAFMMLINETHAQVQKYMPSADSYVKVEGTSTLHDWEMKSESIASEARFKTGENGQPEQLESVSFRLIKTSLKSDKSGLDRRAYEALNAKRYPEIVFRANGGSFSSHDNEYRVSSLGELTIAGVTRQINVEAVCINGDDRKLVCSGSQKLKMTDFKIDPPVMMLGALRTGDEITISYSIVYVQ